MDEEAKQLLREIRDLLASKEETYANYLEEAKQVELRTAQRFDDTSAVYETQFSRHRRDAWQRLVAWMIWATVMISVFGYWGR